MAAREIYTTAFLSDANLQAYYRFNTGALTTDSGPNGRTLTNNGTTGESASGKFGYCADQGTSNSTKYFQVSNRLGYEGGAESIVGWFKIRTQPSDSTGVMYWLGESITNTHLRVYYLDSSGTKTIRFGRSRYNTANDFTDYNYDLGTSDWHHIALTYDGANYTLYVDGEAHGTGASTGAGPNAYPDVFYLGSEGSQFVSAFIDDVAVFNRALTAKEIMSIYNYQAGGAFLYHIL